jgi:hypothetical protein
LGDNYDGGTAVIWCLKASAINRRVLVHSACARVSQCAQGSPMRNQFALRNFPKSPDEPKKKRDALVRCDLRDAITSRQEA